MASDKKARKMARIGKERAEPVEKEPLRMWYTVNERGNFALRRSWRYTVRGARHS